MLFAVRVIAGKFRSRTLRSLRELDIRPTSDRLRETLFNVLTAGDPEALMGSVWLDLFAGTGAVGIEALSRGAEMVFFVENSLSAAAVIEANLRSLAVNAGYQIIRSQSSAAIASLEAKGTKAGFIFLDPPYRMHEAYRETLALLASSPIAGDALIIAEHEKHFDPGAEFGSLHRTRKLTQGDAVLSFYRAG